MAVMAGLLGGVIAQGNVATALIIGTSPHRRWSDTVGSRRKAGLLGIAQGNVATALIIGASAAPDGTRQRLTGPAQLSPQCSVYLCLADQVLVNRLGVVLPLCAGCSRPAGGPPVPLPAGADGEVHRHPRHRIHGQQPIGLPW